MILLKCKRCNGEIEIIGNEYSINKKVKCLECGFTNSDAEKKLPEIVVMKKRLSQ